MLYKNTLQNIFTSDNINEHKIITIWNYKII